MTVESRDLRSSKRRRVLMHATIVTVEGAQTARVRDLTDTGAGVCCDPPLVAGSDVIFKRGNLLVASRVVWSKKNEAGLKFYRPVPIDELTGGASGGDRLFFQA